MNKDTIKSKKDSDSLNGDSEIITSCRNNETVFCYITRYENIFDNSVSITEFGLSLNSYIQKQYYNPDHNWTSDEK